MYFSEKNCDSYKIISNYEMVWYNSIVPAFKLIWELVTHGKIEKTKDDRNE